MMNAALHCRWLNSSRRVYLDLNGTIVLHTKGSQSTFQRILRRLKSSTPSLDKVFSPENKMRCQAKALTVKPVREVPWTMKGKTLQQASVLVPLCTVGGEPSILFTLRTNQLGNYRGQVSFPGGKQDSGESLVETALRETREEIGLDTANIDVWGQMPPVPAKNFEMVVTPVMAFIGETNIDTLVPNHKEVAEIFSRSISSLISADHTRYTNYVGKHVYTLPVYSGGAHRVWGLSAVVLHQALSLLLPGVYTFKIPKFHAVR